MKICKWLVALWMTLALAACGGGGGNAGTQAGGASSSGAIALQLVDEAGTVLSTPSLSQTSQLYLKVTLTNARGGQSFKRVTVTLDSQLAVLTPQSGSLLTDASGVALFAIAPAAVTASGAVTATARATMDDGEVSQSIDLQVGAGNVVLSGLSVTPGSVQLGQSVSVSVNASVNGLPAASNSVKVAFTSVCGTVSPADAAVDSSGRAYAVIQTTVAGNCLVTAVVAGVAQSVTASFAVAAAPATGIQFVQASPEVIYQQDSTGANSSIVKFKVIDSSGNPVSGRAVSAVLVNGTGSARFCDGATAGSTAVSAAGSGEAVFSVCAGLHPETLQVRASLDLDGDGIPDLYTDSNILRVQTGLPTQRFFDIAADRLNFYAGGHFTSKFNNDSVNITVNLADRQGNPVPNGTPVVFVAEGGQINSSNVSSCIVDNGSCTVRLIGQAYRPMGAAVGDPRPGRVTVLAMADGEESFVDANNNNRYDPGELFEDLGRPFMDKNEDLALTTAYQNLVTDTDEGELPTYPVPDAAVGNAACPVNSNVGLSVAGSCNGVWNGSGSRPGGGRYTPTKVRRAIVIVFSGGEIGQPGWYDASIPANNQTAVLSRSRASIVVRLADYDGNPLPADAKLSVNVRKPEGSECTATILGGVIGNSTEPTTEVATLEKCQGGGVETVEFKVEVAVGGSTKVSVFGVEVP